MIVYYFIKNVLCLISLNVSALLILYAFICLREKFLIGAIRFCLKFTNIRITIVTDLVVDVFFSLKRTIIFYFNISIKECAKKKQIFTKSRSETFFEICVLKNFANITGKRLRWSLFLIKLPTCVGVSF